MQRLIYEYLRMFSAVKKLLIPVGVLLFPLGIIVALAAMAGGEDIPPSRKEFEVFKQELLERQEVRDKVLAMIAIAIEELRKEKK